MTAKIYCYVTANYLVPDVCCNYSIIIIIIKWKLKAQINRKYVTNVPRWHSYWKL